MQLANRHLITSADRADALFVWSGAEVCIQGVFDPLADEVLEAVDAVRVRVVQDADRAITCRRHAR
jgi:hypothetical protein